MFRASSLPLSAWISIGLFATQLLVVYEGLNKGPMQSPLEAEANQPIISPPPVHVDPSSRPFVFLHVPKTAGTTITEYLKAHMREVCSEVYLDLPESLTYIMDFARSFQKQVTDYTSIGMPLASAVETTLQDKVFTTCFFTHILAAPDYDGRVDFLKLVFGQGARFRFVLGHLPFGYCQLVEKGCTYVTVLRDPLERLYSHFKYIQRNHPSLLADMCSPHNCTTFKEYIRTTTAPHFKPQPDFDNLQTRMLAGDAFWTSFSRSKTCLLGLSSCDVTPPRRITEEHLTLAKQHILKDVSVVGLTEHLGLFKKAMEVEHGLNTSLPFDYLNPKDKAGGIQGANLTEEEMAMLRDSQRYDIELYEFAKQLVFSQAQRYYKGSLSASSSSASQSLRQAYFQPVSDSTGDGMAR